MVERLWERSKPIGDSIPKNGFRFFTNSKKISTKKDQKLAKAKNDVALFSRLFIACRSRDGDLEQFFARENQSSPPTLFDKGELLPAMNKSAIIDCLMLPEISQPSESPPVDVKIFDGPAIVNMVMPCTSKTFTEYALDEFLPYLQRQSGNAKRVDVVWDRNFKDSLKGNTRINRGVGVRRKVTPGGPDGVIPDNWSTFLCCSPNKVELFPFLSETIVKEANEPLLVATVNESVICNKNISLQGLMPCSIEEADERMLLHAKHVSKHGTRVSIKTVDSDVLSVAVAAYKRMKGLTELWVEMGKGNI